MTHHILIIDDDEDICAIITTVLEEGGYTVATAVDEEALRVAHADPPSLVLLDLSMPHMDGYEVGRRLHADPVTAAIPIVVMSAGRHTRAGAAQVGAQGYLVKPFSLAQLDTMVALHARPAS